MPHFDAVCTSFTSLTCKSELEGISLPFAPPPPSLHTKVSQRFIHITFQHRSHIFHLLRMQEQDLNFMLHFDIL
jgi:hypothetical protein